MKYFILIIYIIALFLSSPLCAFESEGKIAEFQNQVKDKPVAERIVFWAEQFVGTPYDTDPLGEYVTKKVIVADERIDCMYHVFRTAELALSNTPAEAQEKALNLRFLHSKGILKDTVITNYDNRFQEGIDMILSGKWGKDITEELGKTIDVEGSKGLGKQKTLLKDSAIKAAEKLKSGDIIFFIKDPKRRVAGEIVGHMGIIKKEGYDIYLIHASGKKGETPTQNQFNKWEVKKVGIVDYLRFMRFIGIKVTRF
ncbi:MAG TPA: hypothetical protein VJ000_01430 [Thermodesulfovibrionia bacterium]|nr:hypothetical protein [Thermodesulfovibrionia bacterium]